MKLFATCPECGYKLGRSEDGTVTEVFCPKCSALVRYEITDGKVTAEIIQHSDKTAKHIRRYAEKLEQN